MRPFRPLTIVSLPDANFSHSITVIQRLINYGIVVNYYDTIEKRPVASTVEPGYLRKLLPEEAPQDGEAWADIQKDIEAKILPGITHWFVSAMNVDFPAPCLVPQY